jgi:hypothetical protein
MFRLGVFFLKIVIGIIFLVFSLCKQTQTFQNYVSLLANVMLHYCYNLKMNPKLIFVIPFFSFLLMNGQKNSFNCDIGGLPSYTPSTESWGMGLYLEPKFNISDNIALGLKTDWFLSFGGNFESDGSVKFDIDEFLNDNDPNSTGITNNDFNITELGFKVESMLNIAVTADYFFFKKPVTPFVGFGIGYYDFDEFSFSLDAFSHNSSDEFSMRAEDGSSMGVLFRGGVQLFAFRLSFEYNRLFSPAKYSLYFNSSGYSQKLKISESEYSKNYLGFKIGAVIKGGRRNFDNLQIKSK